MDGQIDSETFPTPDRSSPIKRIQLDDGQLNLIKLAASSLPFDFEERLMEAAPWKNIDKKKSRLQHGGSSRYVDDFNIAGVPIMVKESHYSGKDLQLPIFKDRSTSLKSSPIAQISLINQANELYKSRFGNELPFEEPLGYYYDQATTKRYTLFRFYEPYQFDRLSEEGRAIQREAQKEVDELDKQLSTIGVDRGEIGGNYVIRKDTNVERGWSIILVDAELLRINSKAEEPKAA
jgi:hypothetical protein